MRVPSDWAIVRADELGQVVAGGTPSTEVDEYWGGDIAWVTPADLSGFRGKRIAAGARRITGRGLAASSARLIPPGSILFSSRAPIGYVAIAGAELCTNQGFKNLVPSEAVSSDYLYYYFLSIRELARSRASGTTFKELSAKGFASLPVVLAPRVEQRAVVAKIEALFSELDKGIEQLQTIKQQLKQYRQAVLKAAFEGKLTAVWRAEQQAAGTLPSAEELLEQVKKEREACLHRRLAECREAAAGSVTEGGKAPRQGRLMRSSEPQTIPAPTRDEVPSNEGLPEGWCWTRISDLTLGVEYGTAKKSLPGGSVVVLRMGNIQGCRFDWADLVFTDDPDEIEKYALRPGDVLFNRTNSPELVGKAAVYRGERKAIFAGYLIRLNQIPNIVNADYLNYFLNSHIARQYGNSVKTDGVNQSNISGGKLVRYPFPYCSLAEQQAVVSEVESRFSVMDELEKVIDRGLEQSAGLRQSILMKAFEGRLLSEADLAAVRSDPEYEPADKLLERIQVEKGLGEQPSGSRRSRRRSDPARLSRPRDNTAEARSEAR